MQYTRRILVASILCLATMAQGEGIAPSAEETKPLEPGAAVPAVTLQDRDGKELELAMRVKEKPTAIVFYRGGWCPYCTKHLAALKDAIEPLKEKGFEILAITPDTPEKIAETATKHELPYTLLSDAKLDAAKAFGVAFSLDTVTSLKYKAYGVSLVEGSLPVPSVFLTTKDGTIAWSHINADYKERLSPEELLAAAKKVSVAKAE